MAAADSRDDRGIVTAHYRHDQTISPATRRAVPRFVSGRQELTETWSPGDVAQRAGSAILMRPRRRACRRNRNPVPLRGESESTMSSYLTAIAIMLLVLSPLFVPVAITVAPLVSSGVRRIGRAFGLYRPRPASPDHHHAKPERSRHAHRIHHPAAGDADRDRRHIRRIRSARGRPGRVLRRQGQRRRRRCGNRAVPPHAPARGATRRPAAADRRRRPLRVQGPAPGRRARRSSPTSQASRPRRRGRSPR